ncbi:hypothetical protein FB451DRAFT_1402652 [Mycena latifolia]|nr:hypothetical protein FB451DRAFT_1402652 [Mycena latifolia]
MYIGDCSRPPSRHALVCFPWTFIPAFCPPSISARAPFPRRASLSWAMVFPISIGLHSPRYAVRYRTAASAPLFVPVDRPLAALLFLSCAHSRIPSHYPPVLVLVLSTPHLLLSPIPSNTNSFLRGDLRPPARSPALAHAARTRAITSTARGVAASAHAYGTNTYGAGRWASMHTPPVAPHYLPSRAHASQLYSYPAGIAVGGVAAGRTGRQRKREEDADGEDAILRARWDDVGLGAVSLFFFFLPIPLRRFSVLSWDGVFPLLSSVSFPFPFFLPPFPPFGVRESTMSVLGVLENDDAQDTPSSVSAVNDAEMTARLLRARTRLERQDCGVAARDNPRLLTLAYPAGVQLWDASAPGGVAEVLNLRVLPSRRVPTQPMKNPRDGEEEIGMHGPILGATVLPPGPSATTAGRNGRVRKEGLEIGVL